MKDGYKICSPTNGGCWFCRYIGGDMVFDVEFDTYVHPECITERLGKGDEEAEIMSYLVKQDAR
jgi:hypothetical protein